MPARLRFQAVAFIGSFLAFCLELAAAKLLLPRLGGSAYVWTGAMMFFQGVLFLGYAYCREVTRRWGVRGYSRIHLFILLIPFFFFPLRLPQSLSGAGPLGELLRTLALSVGAPFFVLSMTVIVVQGWLMESSVPGRDDPYFFYAASNAGAACALIAYPFAIEPLLALGPQSWLWRGLYACYAGLCISCRPTGPTSAPVAQPDSPPASARQRALWLLLSAAPCTALLATTNLLTLDFAAVPLLWTAPLAAYLLTFVLNFKREPWYPDRLNGSLLRLGALWVAFCLAVIGLGFWFSKDATPLQILGRLLDIGKFGYVIAALFALSMIFHRSLALSRPSSEPEMAEYYTWIAAGGWFGGAVIALAVPWLGRDSGATALDWAAVALVSVSAIVLRDWEQLASHRVTAAALAGLALLLAGGVARGGLRSGTVFSLRNFYGIYTVQDKDGVRWFFHGNTEHGEQFLDPAKQALPLSYYSKDSPLGDAFKTFGVDWKSVGVVGLGVGSIAAYGRPGQAIDFYELDPDVVAIARRWFTHLKLCPATVRVVTGDARLSLERADGALYDVLILDAFNSGAVPIHLLTKEAFAIYLRRLRPGGVILVHVSNRYLDLRAMLAAAARDMGLNGAAKRQVLYGSAEEGQVPSVWAALSSDAAKMDSLVKTSDWRLLDATGSRASAWTDQHASLLSVLAL